jgi:Ca2+-binding EF-hand superfamily protein
MQAIFMDLLDHDTEEIKIKDFVEHMLLLCDEPRKNLQNIMMALDADNSGTISLDEFLDFFGMVKNEEDEEAKAQMEQLLNDELWPKWLIKEAKLATA